MSTTQRTRLVNPRLGTYFGIFVSTIVSLVLIAAIVEQLGAPEIALRWIMLCVPLAMFMAIGVSAHTQEPHDFFAAGRRVPAFFSGLGIAATALGSAGIVCFTGLLLINGIDAWSLANGVVAGFVVCSVMVAPYVRKFGCYTLPSFLGRRFDSRLLRIVSAAVLCAPLMLIIIAEIKIGLSAGAWLTGTGEALIAALFAITLITATAPGGLRSVSWSGAAAAITLLIAIMIPAAIVATDATNLPLAQFSHGPVLRAIGRLEQAQAVPIPILTPLVFDLAGQGLEPLTRRMAHPFGSLGPASFVLLSLTIMMGIAVAPWLMPRIGATPGIYEARKSLGWAVFAFGAVILTASAIAVFERDFIMGQLVGSSTVALPDWFKTALAAGHVNVDGRLPQPPLSAFSIKRDSALFLIPAMAQFPPVLSYFLLAGGVAAAFAGASAAIFALSTIIAEDGINGGRWDAPSALSRLVITRLAIVGTSLLCATLAVYLPTDPLFLVIWAVGISGAALFPAVVLSIWWKQFNSAGALAAVIVGFACAIGGILAGRANWIGIPHEIISFFAAGAGFIAAIVGTRLGAAPSRQVLELVRDTRVPGGETVYDREQRLIRLKQRQRPT
jgi:cation/acetate symporter